MRWLGRATSFAAAAIGALAVVLAPATPAAAQTVHFAQERIAWDESSPAAGFWMGNLKLASGTLFIACDVATGADGAPTARVTVLNLGAIESPAEQVTIERRTLKLTLRTAAASLEFTAEINDDGQRMTGPATIIAGPQKLEGALELGRSLRPLALPGAMAFTGKLAIPGVPQGLEMAIALAATPGGNWVGHMDVPAQGLRGYPLMNVRREGRRITADIAVPGGGAIDVELADDDRSIRGRFKQATLDVPLEFQRDDHYVAPSLVRPQEPKPPLPYDVRQLTAKHPAGHELAGTLTLPRAEPGSADAPAQPRGRWPVAVLISGSGQQDRDETIVGHKPFLVLADRLTRAGIAVMRYDDRGVGLSTGRETLEAATSRDFATDTLAVIDALRNVPEIDADRIGLVGHSEGGIIAPMVAQMVAQMVAKSEAEQGRRIAFIVLLAGPGVSGREILLEQNARLMKAHGTSDEASALVVARLDAALKLAGAADADPAAVREAVKALVQAQVAAAGAPPENATDEVVDAAVKQLTIPWMQYFCAYDPRPALAALTRPVLACNGTLDLQVWHEQNLPVIEQAIRAAGGDITIRRYENLNHLFQPARSGGLSEYAAIETTFDESAISDITQWIRSKVTQP